MPPFIVVQKGKSLHQTKITYTWNLSVVYAYTTYSVTENDKTIKHILDIFANGRSTTKISHKHFLIFNLEI